MQTLQDKISYHSTTRVTIAFFYKEQLYKSVHNNKTRTFRNVTRISTKKEYKSTI